MDRIVGVILAGVLLLLAGLNVYDSFQSGTHSVNIENYRNHVTQWHTNMVAHYYRQTGRYGVGALDPTFLIKYNIAPSSAIATSSTLTNPFGGNETVTGATLQYDEDDDNISDADCGAIMSQFTNSMGIVQIQVAAAIAGVSGAAAYTSLPATDAQIKAACTNGTNAVRLVMQ